MQVKSKISRGFGLVEIMIALALGMVVILGITQLFFSSSRSQTDIDTAGRNLESALFSVDILLAELQLAGFWAGAYINRDQVHKMVDRGYDPALFDPINLPPACIGTGESGIPAVEELAWGMAYPIQSQSNVLLTPELSGGSNCKVTAPLVRAASEYVAIRRAATCAWGEAGCFDFGANFHIQVNGCDAAKTGGIPGGLVQLSNADPTDAGNFEYRKYDPSASTSDCSLVPSATERAPIHRYLSKVFYVDQDDRLIALVLNDNSGNPAYEVSVIAENVEHMVFEWGVDKAADGTEDGVPDHWVRFDHSDSDFEFTDEQWRNVVAAKVWLVVRSPEEVPGYTDTGSYTVAGQSYSPRLENQGYARTVHSRTVSLKNLVWSK